MSDLTQFRDHARFMADREHAPGCPPERSKPSKPHRFDAKHVGWKWCGNESEHAEHAWKGESRFGGDYAPEWRCVGICGGCHDPKARALWSRLAAEVDDYLNPPVEEDLFGQMTTTPSASVEEDERG